MSLGEILIGWAEDDPKEAWRTAVEVGREVSEHDLLGEILSQRLVILAGKVAEVDPEFALGEFWRGPSLARSGMLEGMCRVLPVGYPWQTLMREVALSRKVDDPGVREILQGRLMGRWMEDDVGEAVKWFGSLEAEVILKRPRRHFYGGGYAYVTSDGDEEVVSLAEGALFWHLRAPGEARKWLRDHPELLRQVFTWRNDSEWNPRQLGEMRKTLVYCLDKMEREKLVRSLMEGWGYGRGSRGLGRLLSGSEESMMGEIGELRVSGGLEDEILEGLNLGD